MESFKEKYEEYICVICNTLMSRLRLCKTHEEGDTCPRCANNNIKEIYNIEWT